MIELGTSCIICSVNGFGITPSARGYTILCASLHWTISGWMLIDGSRMVSGLIIWITCLLRAGVIWVCSGFAVDTRSETSHR